MEFDELARAFCRTFRTLEEAETRAWRARHVAGCRCRIGRRARLMACQGYHRGTGQREFYFT